MYVVCPLCKSAYIVDDVLLPSPLPKAKCCVCENVWQMKDDAKESDDSLFSLGEKLDKKKVARNHSSFRRKLFWNKVLSLALLLLAFSFLGLVWAARVELASRYPVLQTGFDMLGIDSVVEGCGLEFRSVHYRNAKVDGINVLEITGMVVNDTNTRKFIPPIVATLHDKFGKKLEGKVVYLEDRYLAPLGSVSFNVRILSPSDRADRVTVSFIQK